MGNEKELVRNVGRVEPRSLSLGLLLGFFLALFTYISVSDRYVTPLLTVESRVASSYGVPTSPMVEKKMNSSQLGLRNATEENLGSDLLKKNDAIKVQPSSSSIIRDASSGRLDASSTQKLGNGNIGEDRHEQDGEKRVPDKSSSTSGDSTQKEDIINPKQPGERSADVKPQRKPICDFSSPRSDVCKMEGDVRIHGKSSSVVFVTSNQMRTPESNESWRVKPYTRKSHKTAMKKIREVSVKMSNSIDAPRCTLNHSIPAVVFAIGGYTGNLYHDFADVLLPLFITSRQFNGEAQLLITNSQLGWVHKYRHILKRLGRYEIIDFDNDDQVRCYPHAIVGLESYKDMYIDPLRDPNGYSILDFTKFLSGVYSLDRDSPIKMGEHPEKKPRLAIIDRHRTRRLINIEEIVKMAEELGYEVLRAEAKFETDVADFARIINSCDVMMGVHGAGLTNMIFLPRNAVFIQVVPWGGLEWVAKYDYGDPAKNMKLQYMEYGTSKEESTLIDLYPRDHPVLKDPTSFHRQGWNAMAKVYMVEQSVKLDLRRFRTVLLKALELLH
ncbi:alpha-1,3-arabinosyltransferase XAT3-like isoform X2 [Elaeis guineensis]|uniref:Alpha-1,3-arabinosyltransferase XAT3-like isoform X2 n=1 Tax=Elaeis guineensis var. tenera TaxID=51953 RepID=A0A6I9QWP5_ELAGV|nr:alpha-1,3-arabinosyltransferase XAT3-like isoform X2 [Elaeis guineensis]